MNAAQVARAVEMVLRGKKGKPVLLYVRLVPGSSQAEPSAMIPCGRTRAVLAGNFDKDVTLGELAEALSWAEKELKAGRTAH